LAGSEELSEERRGALVKAALNAANEIPSRPKKKQVLEKILPLTSGEDLLLVKAQLSSPPDNSKSLIKEAYWSDYQENDLSVQSADSGEWEPPSKDITKGGDASAKHTDSPGQRINERISRKGTKKETDPPLESDPKKSPLIEKIADMGN